jgi:hypothetical protein
MTRYVIGPDAAIHLAGDEAVVPDGHHMLARRFFARSCCRSSTRRYAAVR